jgi:hypothetical protein
MKITLTEFERCFSFDMEAETLAEAAMLVRFGMNRTDEIRSGDTLVNKHPIIDFTASLVIGKSRRASNVVPKRK